MDWSSDVCSSDLDLVPLAVIGIAASVIGAFYYLKVVKTMYFDEPAPAFAAADSRINMALVAAAAVFVSPLGYLAIPLLSAATANRSEEHTSELQSLLRNSSAVFVLNKKNNILLFH